MDMVTISIVLAVILIFVMGIAIVLWNTICPAISPEMQRPEVPAAPNLYTAPTQKAPVTRPPAIESPEPDPAQPPDTGNVVDLAEWRNRRAG